jgi:hypothetical protein
VTVCMEAALPRHGVCAAVDGVRRLPLNSQPRQTPLPAVASRVGPCVQASYYISYIITSGLLGKCITFLRLPGAVIFLLLSKFAGTKRQKKKTWSRQYMQYGTDVPDHTITILLLLVFSVSQPFVAVVSVMYFVVVFFCSRYNLLYTLREDYQTGGLFWPVVRPCDHFERCFYVLCWTDQTNDVGKGRVLLTSSTSSFLFSLSFCRVRGTRQVCGCPC